MSENGFVKKWPPSYFPVSVLTCSDSNPALRSTELSHALGTLPSGTNAKMLSEPWGKTGPRWMLTRTQNMSTYKVGVREATTLGSKE